MKLSENQPKLPVDDIIDGLKQALIERNEVILEAPPGAGKTTRVPINLLDQPWLQGKRMNLPLISER